MTSPSPHEGGPTCSHGHGRTPSCRGTAAGGRHGGLRRLEVPSSHGGHRASSGHSRGPWNDFSCASSLGASRARGPSSASGIGHDARSASRCRLLLLPPHARRRDCRDDADVLGLGPNLLSCGVEACRQRLWRGRTRRASGWSWSKEWRARQRGRRLLTRLCGGGTGQ